MSLTFEKSQLARHGVGGIFHFAYQSSEMEEFQHPAIYIFSSANRATRTIYSWGYRVAAVQGGLCVESQNADNSGNVRNVNFDSASRYDVEAYTENELLELVNKDLAILPFYYFCGFGFVHPSDRRGFGLLASSDGKREDVFDNSGKLTASIGVRLKENFDY